jgi:hypothetical protein
MLVDLPDNLARELIAVGVGRAIDPARVAPAVKDADALPADDKMSGEFPAELNETQMAALLGMKDAEALRKQRDRGLYDGLYRKQNGKIIYTVPLMMAAYRRRVRSSPDTAK